MEINVNVNGRIEIDASERLAAIILGGRRGADAGKSERAPQKPSESVEPAATYGTTPEARNAATEPLAKPQAVSAAPALTGSAELTEAEEAAQAPEAAPAPAPAAAPAPAPAPEAPARKEITDADLREFMDNAAWEFYHDHLNDLDPARQRTMANLFRTISKGLGADRPTALRQDQRDEFRRILVEDVKLVDGRPEIRPF